MVTGEPITALVSRLEGKGIAVDAGETVPSWWGGPVKGEAFVIAKAGKPFVKVAALDSPAVPQRLGFLAGEIAVPDDFDRMGEAEIAAQFGDGG